MANINRIYTSSIIIGHLSVILEKYEDTKYLMLVAETLGTGVIFGSDFNFGVRILIS